MIDRRNLLGAALALAATRGRAEEPGLSLGAARPFSGAALEDRAADLARRAHSPRPTVPAAWRDLDYDQYRAIWFDGRNALFRDTARPLRVDLFHPGLYFPRPVGIHVVEAGEARRVAFDPAVFDRTDQVPDLPVDETLGYSGLRLRGELETPGIFTEYCVFQGASYFRAIGQGMSYGLSARGLAVDTAAPEGEEFPDFTDFWIEAPAPGAETVTLHALMDGPSVTGAYRFAITPGDVTRMQVRATVFARRDLPRVGVAPLTSMFLYDETNRDRFDDFRPAVHDSDGLLIRNGADEQLWRPLANPRALQVASFLDDSPRGFGLCQRARDLDDFADLEARYHDRPSLWIEPDGAWGPGAVTLVEIPAQREIYDNIVAYWQPEGGLARGGPHRFGYAMAWCERPAGLDPVARVLNTRQGLGFDRVRRVFAIDFADHPAFADGWMRSACSPPPTTARSRTVSCSATPRRAACG